MNSSTHLLIIATNLGAADCQKTHLIQRGFKMSELAQKSVDVGGKSSRFSSFSIDSLLSKKNGDQLGLVGNSEKGGSFNSGELNRKLKRGCGVEFFGNDDCVSENRTEDFEKIEDNVVSTSDDFFHRSRDREEGRSFNSVLV